MDQSFPILPNILRQHVEDAAFLWFQRDLASEGYDVDRTHTAALEARLRADFDGMALAPEETWAMAWEQVEAYGELGEIFVAGCLALASARRERVRAVCDVARSRGQERGLAGALAWNASTTIRQVVADWARSSDSLERWLAACACSTHRVDPGPRLLDWLNDDDVRLRRRAVRLAGELGRAELAGPVLRRLQDVDADVSFWAAHSSVLLGATERGEQVLLRVAASPHSMAARAGLLVILAADEERARDRIRWLWQAGAPALAVRLAGLIPGPEIPSWLVAQMRSPSLAVAAGLALADRFALEPNATELFTDDSAQLDPELAKMLPEEPDHPYPIAERVEAWLASGAVTDEPFASNRLRMIAAYRHALRSPTTALPNWRAPLGPKGSC